MTGSGNEAVDGDACLVAAERVRSHLLVLAGKIEREHDPWVDPDNPLPVDTFLSRMVRRTQAPKLTFKPRRLGRQIWTESLTAYVYAGIENAFVKAGKLPGGNRSGHMKKLRGLLIWIERQEQVPSRTVPRFFEQKTALLFSKGILEERRRDRIEVIGRIGERSPSDPTDLAQLKKWVSEDLADSRLRTKGRPVDYQKIVFAAEVANLWNVLTGRAITKGPKTLFSEFLVACWNSGFVDTDVNSSFKRVLRHHIAESPEPYACGRCDKCMKSEKCQRKRYFGTLHRGSKAQ